MLRRRCCWTPATVDRCVLPGVLSSKPATCHSGSRTVEQRDGQMPNRYIDPALHTMLAVSINGYEGGQAVPCMNTDRHALSCNTGINIQFHKPSQYTNKRNKGNRHAFILSTIPGRLVALESGLRLESELEFWLGFGLAYQWHGLHRTWYYTTFMFTVISLHTFWWHHSVKAATLIRSCCCWWLLACCDSTQFWQHGVYSDWLIRGQYTRQRGRVWYLRLPCWKHVKKEQSTNRVVP